MDIMPGMTGNFGVFDGAKVGLALMNHAGVGSITYHHVFEHEDSFIRILSF